METVDKSKTSNSDNIGVVNEWLCVVIGCAVMWFFVAVSHNCSPSCRHSDDDPLKYKGRNPLCIPMEFGWTRY